MARAVSGRGRAPAQRLERAIRGLWCELLSVTGPYREEIPRVAVAGRARGAGCGQRLGARRGAWPRARAQAMAGRSTSRRLRFGGCERPRRSTGGAELVDALECGAGDLRPIAVDLESRQWCWKATRVELDGEELDDSARLLP